MIRNLSSYIVNVHRYRKEWYDLLVLFDIVTVWCLFGWCIFFSHWETSLAGVDCSLCGSELVGSPTCRSCESDDANSSLPDNALSGVCSWGKVRCRWPESTVADEDRLTTEPRQFPEGIMSPGTKPPSSVHFPVLLYCGFLAWGMGVRIYVSREKANMAFLTAPAGRISRCLFSTTCRFVP